MKMFVGLSFLFLVSGFFMSTENVGLTTISDVEAETLVGGKCQGIFQTDQCDPGCGAMGTTGYVKNEASRGRREVTESTLQYCDGVGANDCGKRFTSYELGSCNNLPIPIATAVFIGD